MKLTPLRRSVIADAFVKLASAVQRGDDSNGTKASRLLGINERYPEQLLSVPTHCKYPEDDQRNAYGDARHLANQLQQPSPGGNI